MTKTVEMGQEKDKAKGLDHEKEKRKEKRKKKGKNKGNKGELITGFNTQ